jgi:hypothetical protein
MDRKPTPKAITTYEFKPDELAEILARHVTENPQGEWTLNYVIQEVGDPMDRFPGTKRVTKIELRNDPNAKQ